MDAQSLLYMSMLGGGAGANSDSILPIVLMQLSKKNGDSEGGLSNDVLDVMVYRPLGQRILSNLTAKIAKMDPTQRARLIAALALDRLSEQQEGKLGETLLLASRAGMLDLLGEPVSNAISTASENKGNGSVGVKTLGAAKKSVLDKAKELEVNESGNSTGSKPKTSAKKYPPVY